MNSRIIKILTAISAIFLSLNVYGDGGIYPGNPGQGTSADSLAALYKKAPGSTELLIELCRELSGSERFTESLFYAEMLRNIGEEENDDNARLSGLIYMAQSKMALGETDSLKYYYASALELAKKLNNARALTSIYIGLGIHAVDVEMDYYSGMSYFMEALEHSKESSSERSYPVALNNIAMIHYLRNDPSGLKYALEAYELGHSLQIDYLIFRGAFVTSYMYYLLGDYDQALRYVEEIVGESDKFNSHTDVYNLYANILLETGNEAKAVEYYLKALEKGAEADAGANSLARLSYGEYLISKGRDREAIPILAEGIAISEGKNNATHRYKLYKAISDAYGNTDQTTMALKYHRLYHQQADSIFNTEREYSINELRVRYETEKNERLLQEKEIELLRKNQNTQILVFILAIIILAAIALYVLYRRKNNMYKKIVKQQHDFIKREKLFTSRMNSDAEKQEAAQSDNKFSLTEQKKLELFKQLESLMRDEHIYRENDVTREKVAERLGTNRTYLSQVINELSGYSFSNYINSYRIDEAVRQLSDADNPTPLKALSAELGFNHIQTFYSSFQSAIGMTPSKFREKFMELHKKNEL